MQRITALLYLTDNQRDITLYFFSPTKAPFLTD